MTGVIWGVEDPAKVMVLWGPFGFGWLGIVLASFIINHFDFFGARQVYFHLLGPKFSPSDRKSHIPVQEPVRGACEVLGLDPLYVVNEGRFVFFIPAAECDGALSILHKHQVSQSAVDIGEALSTPIPHSPPVTLRTVVGTHRILDLLSGEQLPRIC